VFALELCTPLKLQQRAKVTQTAIGGSVQLLLPESEISSFGGSEKNSHAARSCRTATAAHANNTRHCFFDILINLQTKTNTLWF